MEDDWACSENEFEGKDGYSVLDIGIDSKGVATPGRLGTKGPRATIWLNHLRETQQIPFKEELRGAQADIERSIKLHAKHSTNGLFNEKAGRFHAGGSLHTIFEILFSLSPPHRSR
jgi:hypothetical protein